MDAEEYLHDLDFGNVDAESEEELADRFVRTPGFGKISDRDSLIILGPKGSGKSALFRLYTDFKHQAENLLDESLPENAHLIKATGGNDLRSLDNRNLQKIKDQDGFSYEDFWEIYIGVKVAEKLGEAGYTSDGELGNVLRALNEQQDWRLLPVLKTVWEYCIGDPPSSGKLSYGNFSIDLSSSDGIFDTELLLENEQSLLSEKDEVVWLLLDRIDELESKDPEKRKELLEALFRTQLTFLGRFDNIRLKIFLRTDIWSELNFVNKSHISDKRIELRWDDTQLLKMINKRMLQSDSIKEYVEESTGLEIDVDNIESIDKESQKDIFYAVFEDTVYPGEREAELFDWMTTRIKDGHGGKYPRELISFCNAAVREELRRDEHPESRLINGYSVRDAYDTVSNQRVNTFLSEFPDLKEHFDKFDTKKTAEYSFDDLYTMFDGLQPSPKNAVDRMVDIGFLRTDRDGDGNRIYEVPRLYREGIGLVIRGRP
ncbi:P-loop ATPase, Sll1717 family [Haloferax volcanii]|uniref:P-loop ATPase, Sll1717 family n=1 Tax=Haloferax volcanii TaxID=2246 RepID=UPI003D302E07